MTGLEWTLVVLVLIIGIGIGLLVGRRRSRREAIARTLVPARTRQVMSAMLSGAVVVRKDRRSAYSNHVAAVLGIARPDGALYPEVANLADEAWRRGEPVEREIEVHRGVLGTSRTVHVRVTPLDDELAFAVANDNTEARAAEQMRRDFAVNVSHELKTPVGAISLLAESIEQGADDPSMVKSFSKKLRKESRRLTKLIQEIIEISRLQAGPGVIDAEEVDVAEVVAEAIDAARTTAQARSIELVAEVKTEPIVLGDHDLLLMAVRNLVDNAVYYSEPGHRVTVTCVQEGDVVNVQVLDQGIGIDAKDLERIFERFYRVDAARSRETGGTGLGLSIVKHIAAQHDGAVDVWSQVGVGSTFTLRLPALTGPPTTLAQENT